jgi:hypothetical protein
MRGPGALDLVSGHAFGRSAVLGATLAIVISTSACDNVEWGGVTLRMVPPPAAQFGAGPDSAEVVEEDGSFTLPQGPVLYAATRDSAGIYVVPVAEIVGDSLSPFRDEGSAPGYRGAFARQLMEPGSRFTLFSAGARVGTFTVGEVGTDERFCTPRPRASGVVELVPEAAAATTFLAIPEQYTDSVGYEPFAPLEHDRIQRAAGIDLAAAVIPQIGATWPSGMVEARGDIQAFRQVNGQPAVSTTFLFRDQMLVQRAEPRSYSLYLLVVPEADASQAATMSEQYRTAYVWYREATREGKGAPRYFQHLDWDGDGETELLLEVLGETRRWHAVVQKRGQEWTRTFEDPCGAAAPRVQEGTAP